MATETDVWRTAWIIADEYGAEGVGFAAEMAKSFEIGGGKPKIKKSGSRSWRKWRR